jgi:hypothetical protein
MTISPWRVGIGTFSDHIDAPICTFDMEFDIGVARHEAREQFAGQERDEDLSISVIERRRVERT